MGKVEVETNEQLKNFIHGSEAERARIARDLHDGVAQTIISIKLFAENAKKTNKLNTDEFIAKLKGMLSEALQEIKCISENESPEMLRERGFFEVLQGLIFRYQNICNLKITISNTQVKEENIGKNSLHIYRIMQEIISNAVKYSKARLLKIEIMKVNDKLIRFIVEDDGVGFEIEKQAKIKDFNNHRGLENIRSRVLLLGGDLNLTSEVGKGTLYKIDFPIFNYETM